VKGSAEDAEQKVTLESLPPAVQRAVKAQSEGATLRGLAKEQQDGATVYEVELTVHGRHRDVILDAQGTTLIVEEETTLSEIPPSARSAIQKAVGKGKLLLVEKVTKGATTFYEAQISDGKAVEVKVDADGKTVK
jgi:uncharacterized membrane protein YkoI